MNWPTLLCRLALGLALLAGLATVSKASMAAPLRLMVAGIDKQIYLPAVLAERLGYFAAQGLQVELLSESSGVHAEDQLLTGAVQGVVGFYDHTIALQAKGKFVQAVVQLGQAPGEALLVAAARAEGLRSLSALEGRTLGVTGLGASTQGLTQYLAAQQGLKPAALHFVAVGSGDSFATALQQGRIDAGTTSEPTVTRLLRSGQAQLLADLRTPAATRQLLGGPYPGASLYVSTRWAAGHADELQRVVNALVQALRYIAGHSAGQIADQLPPEYLQGDRAAYVAALQASLPMFTPDGVMPAGGPETVLRVMQATQRGLQGRVIDLERTYTDAFARAAR
ncbi:ABC transporter substrate-binding protein [Aquincola tertiaricarbonis]|uniref:ABC transporter substrate-binding protein n=1 Tax=Aquincola tertiaricarbonis TaxID=391953 RepID=A0ABY4S459_AQUTE|nr:ABC transporter substrate-binding protein [Aquincola tertiaricarbonis]URI07224.1 ABC transporter substrate-binding protein [Aquincola tertiaricarbonis]